MTINERVRQVRKDLGLSQEAFGERLGITKSAVSKIEKSEIVLPILWLDLSVVNSK